MRISVVIPCFNEQDVLPSLFQRLTAAAETWGCDWEVLCVDDGSGDRTWELLSAQHNADPRWRALRFARNFGHQAAVSAGLYHCVGDAVIVMDSDLQDPPEELARFIEKWQSGYEVVFAIRKKRKEGWIKRVCYWAFYRLMGRLVSFEMPHDSGDFCLMDRTVVDVLNAIPERNRFVRGLRAWAGFRQTGLTYERSARAGGETKYPFRQLVKLALDGIFSFSSVPLRLASHLGWWVSCLALFGVVFTFVQRLFKDFFASFGLGYVPGYAAIISSILFLGGVQLICLGILGEYIGRIYEEVKGRPPWIVQSSVGVGIKSFHNPAR
ncbi:MAG: glycosyltransferase family 2 protein [Verrucomicrobia bacterium]|nr:glycosyltransferase family 2 protein [Verrucomicrobiota bacterium]